jgi:uncharacterized protein
MEFEWDEDKSKLNLQTRGFDFDTASYVFQNDPIIIEDNRNDYKETRYKATGQIEGILTTVVFTIRGEKRRIISAWITNKKGRREWLLSQEPSKKS